MDTLYRPEGVEERWQRTWEEEGLYNADPDPSRPTFVDAHPPPNVTGELHMGHALQLALGDALCRLKRMQGYNVLFQPGYDHAGISTQNAVEKHLRDRREDAPRPRPRGVRGPRLGVAARVRRQDHDPVPAHGRLAGLPARAVHDGRRLRPRGHARVRPPVRQGLDLPREPDHQLVPVPPDLALGSRARPRRARRRADHDPLPVRGRLGLRRDRDRAAGDHSLPTSRWPSIPTTRATRTPSARR